MTMALLILDVGDDDGLCAVSGELASRGHRERQTREPCHVTCAFGDNDHRQTDLKLKKKENLTKCEE